MTLTRTYQNELKSWLAGFHSDAGLPKKAVTPTLPQQKLIVQYETKGETPNISKCARPGKNWPLLPALARWWPAEWQCSSGVLYLAARWRE